MKNIYLPERALHRLLFVPGKRLWLKNAEHRNKWNLFTNVTVILLTILLTCYATFLVSSLNRIDHHPNNRMPSFIYREEWGGRPPRHLVQLNHSLPIVVIRDTKGLFCIEKCDCMESTLQIQTDDLLRNLTDISYNFLIGGDGNIYVGRGWGVMSAYSNKTLDIAFHGNYKFDYPYPDMIRAAKLLIHQGVRMHYIDRKFSVICQNQTKVHERSSRHLCGAVRTWREFDNRTHFHDL